MKKICLVVPDLNKGGMERVMSELAGYFSMKEDTQVNLVLLTNRSAIFYKIPDSVNIHLPSFQFDTNKRLRSTLKTVRFLRRTLKMVKPDAILSFGETYNSFVLLSTLFLKMNVFVSDRSKPDKRWGLVQERLRRILYPRASGIVSQTSYSRKFLMKEVGHSNIRVIANPVRQIGNGAVQRENVILNVGRIIGSKRIDLLLEIFSKSYTDNWELWLVGDDEVDEKKNLEEQAKTLGIEDRVKFWGKQENIAEFYSRARIFAFTSESEGMPNVLLEAMSAGLACVSFDCVAGPSDMIEDGESGYLVPLYEIDEYVEKLNTLLTNPDSLEQFSKAAKRRSEDFHIKIIGEKYYNFLLEDEV